MSDKPEHIGLDSKPLTERDRIDLGHEQSGENVGRIKRFLTQNDTNLYGENSEKKKQDHATNMLMYMLQNDPLYAAAYRRLENTVNNAQQAVDTALLDIEQRLAQSVETLQKMEDNAGELEDGTKVFRDNQGNIITENGKVLSAQEAQNVTIPENAPSWEEYQRQKQQIAQLQREREEIERYQREVLDDVRRRMDDKENPLTKDELEEEERRIKREMPDIVKRFSVAEPEANVSAASVASEIADNPPFAIPEMSAAFEAARDNTSAPTVTEQPPKFDIPAIVIR